MIFAELLAILGVFSAAGIGVSAIVAWIRRSDAHDKERRAQDERRSNDLRKALESHDHRNLDDWLAIYGDQVSADVRKHVELRRDELYIEKNP